MTHRRCTWSAAIAAASIGAVVAAAVAEELRKPAAERTWHGKVAGVIPYDFRPPTLERARTTWWDPEGEHVLTGQVFGVGWTVNFGRLARLAGLTR